MCSCSPWVRSYRTFGRDQGRDRPNAAVGSVAGRAHVLKEGINYFSIVHYKKIAEISNAKPQHHRLKAHL